jgi:hypothetical protein
MRGMSVTPSFLARSQSHISAKPTLIMFVVFDFVCVRLCLQGIGPISLYVESKEWLLLHACMGAWLLNGKQYMAKMNHGAQPLTMEQYLVEWRTQCMYA